MENSLDITYLKLAVDKIINNISRHKETVDAVRELLCDPEAPELALMMEYVNACHANIDAETKEEDPEWFEGLASSSTTKQKAMRDGAKGRIRGYLTKSKEFADKSVSMNNSLTFYFVTFIHYS